MNTITYNVLLVEDDPDMPEILEALLHGDNVRLSSARNAPQALEMVRRNRYDLVLLDLGLPGINGLDLLRHLKEAPDTESIPVIILTAWNSTADKLRGFELGAVDYLTKPYEAAELRARLRATLRTKHLQDELTRTNRELSAARIAAESSARAKAEFLATMSHEIRTPMNGITSMAELLLQTPLSPDQQGMVETIYSSGQSLLRIINDILDFSRVESGRLELEKQPFDLRLCVESALDVLAAKAAEKRLDLVYQIEEGIPGELVGDSTRLRQVLVNLLSNGVKFTHHGEVVLHVKSMGKLDKPEDGALRQLHFSVRDTGIGIAEGRMAKLFQSFSQAEASTCRQYGGSGLGLAISKKLVELMGGRMWVESVSGKGSTFHFTVTMPAGAVVHRGLDVPEPRLTSRRLLIVDDNPTNGHVLTVQTSRWGMAPRATHRAEQALEWLGQGEHFDVALVDLEMQGIDGVTLAKRIRGLPAGSELPIVMLMPVGVNHDTIEGIGTSLTKPVKRQQLKETLARVLGGGKPKEVAPRKTEGNVADRLPLRILLCDDNIVNQKVAIRLLKQLGYTADIAANGLEALSAIEQKVYDLVFMDVMMPEMGGFEATQEIRKRQQDRTANPNFKHPLVIVAMTANAMQGDREKCLEAGMDDYLSKPVRLEDIRGVLEKWGALACQHEPQVEIHRQTAMEDEPHLLSARLATPVALSQPVAPPTVRSAAEPPVDMARLDEFTDGSLENLEELTGLYLRQTGEQLEKLGEAVRSGAAAEVRRLAHSSAGASATCGMRGMVAPLKQLEKQGQDGNLTNAAELCVELNQEFARVKHYLSEVLASRRQECPTMPRGPLFDK